MVRIPKISFESFYCFFSIHDLIRDLMENFQKCSVDSPPPPQLSRQNTVTRTAVTQTTRIRAIKQLLGCLQCITTSNRHYAPIATYHLLINSLHSQFPQSQFIFL